MIHEEMIPTLLQVAHRVLIWIEPLLYRTLVFLANGDAPARLCGAIQRLETKPRAFWAQVRDATMWRDRREAMDMDDLLLSCTNIKKLSLRTVNSRLVDCISSLRLQRLTSPVWSLLLPTCAFLTHLHVIAWDGNAVFLWISTLPSLTPLCLTNPSLIYRPSIESNFNNSRQLRVCVLSFSRWYQDDPDPWIDQDRVVLMRFTVDDNNYARDWKLGVTGGRDFWVRAEGLIFLAAKQER
ncbi:hypothetical protein C8R47DRAFT_589294 [Mycena vitilis]|nr:hypothetical protein C8R47DRAFT_589294 [Mycena vitilis]